MAKSKYSNAEKKAYYSGMGYAVAYHGKRVPFKNEKNRTSFRNGWEKGKSLIAKLPNWKKAR